MMLDRDSDDDHDFWALHETPDNLNCAEADISD